MEDSKVLFKVKEQLSKDYNCTIEDFNNNENLITDLKIIEGCRKYNNEKEIMKILIFNGKIIISADDCIKNWCIENLKDFPGEWLFLYSALRRIDKKLNEFG
ncbi:MAG: GNAT family N-acetyltransferase, partial [Clostridium sartagoforme]|nr:GNAT family N-acetyltransferase [Clostridium sartagoforme]